ncbi:hypothetical protein D3C72_974170 [compost metagenome]
MPGITRGQPQADAGVVSSHRAEQRAGQHVGGAGQQAHGDDASYGSTGRPYLGPCPVQLIQGAARVILQRLTGIRQLHSEAASGEERGSDIVFKQLQLARYRRLHDVQQTSGAGHAAGFGHGHECLQLLQVHRGLPGMRMSDEIHH